MEKPNNILSKQTNEQIKEPDLIKQLLVIFTKKQDVTIDQGIKDGDKVNKITNINKEIASLNEVSTNLNDLSTVIDDTKKDALSELNKALVTENPQPIANLPEQIKESKVNIPSNLVNQNTGDYVVETKRIINNKKLEEKIIFIDTQINNIINEKKDTINLVSTLAKEDTLNELKQDKNIIINDKTNEVQIILSGIAINFDFGKSEIDPKYYELLHKISSVLRVQVNSKITIAGHTCDIGSDKYNLKLSKERAEAVMNYFINNENLLKDNLSPVGYGKEKPIVSNDSEENRAKNRRVEIIIGK